MTSIMPGVITRTVEYGNKMVPGQEITCSSCGGTNVIMSDSKSTHLPETALRQIWQRRGWFVHKKAKHKCPQCSIKPKKLAANNLDQPKHPSDSMDVIDTPNSPQRPISTEAHNEPSDMVIPRSKAEMTKALHKFEAKIYRLMELHDQLVTAVENLKDE